MKLYTEEQVRQAIKMADKYHHVLDSEEAEIISVLEPIELPSDEEIDKEATYREPNNTRRAFFSGAKYVIEQIKKQV